MSDKPIEHQPSNAPPGFPKMSPEGYNIKYGLEPVYDANGNRIGTTVAKNVKPRLIYGSTTFADAEEIEDYLSRLPGRSAGLDKERQRWLQEVHNGPIPAAQLYTADGFYLRKRYEQRIGKKHGDLFFLVCSGDNPAVARLKMWTAYEMPQDFDAEKHDGPYRALIDRINDAGDEA